MATLRVRRPKRLRGPGWLVNDINWRGRSVWWVVRCRECTATFAARWRWLAELKAFGLHGRAH